MLKVNQTIELGNIDVERDWGYAPDYVLGMWLMLQQETPSDYILATGTTHKLSEFLETAFHYFDLDYKKYVRVNQKFIRPNEPKKTLWRFFKSPKILGLETIFKLSPNLFNVRCANWKIKLIK